MVAGTRLIEMIFIGSGMNGEEVILGGDQKSLEKERK